MLAQVVQRVQQPRQVHVVERGFHLVHHVEGAGAGREYREQQGQRGQRTFAARQQAQLLDALAGGTRFDNHARAQHVVRVFKPEPAGTTREQGGEHMLECGGRVFERAGEHTDHGLVQVLHEFEQVLTAFRNIVTLVVQILVARVERLIFLGGERVDLAQGLEVALGAFQTFDLLLPHVRDSRRGCLILVLRFRLVFPRSSGMLRRQHRHRVIRGILLDQLVHIHTERVRDLLRELSPSGSLPFTLHIKLMFVALQTLHLGFQPVALRPQCFQFLIMGGQFRLQIIAALCGADDARMGEPCTGGGIIRDLVRRTRPPTTGVVLFLDSHLSLSRLFGVVAQQADLPLQGLGLPVGFLPCEFRGHLLFARLPELLLELMFASGEVVKVGVRILRFLCGRQRLAHILKLALMVLPPL